MDTSGPSAWSVEFYTNAAGKSPCLEFIDGLPVREQASVKRSLQLLQEFGLQLPRTYVKPIVGHRKLWELSVGPNRLLYFGYSGRTFVILHGFRKKSAKTPPAEIKIATDRMAEFTSRPSGGRE